MNSYPFSIIGKPVSEVDTPSLLLDLDAFERNLKKLSSSLAGTKVKARPHSKSHKCPMIALQQIAHGAVGVCCQKVSEAEAMVQGGIHNVLVSNQIVDKSKIERLVSLVRQADVSVCADNSENIDALNDTARNYGVKLSVLVEIDVGMGRCGVKPGREAAETAAQISGSSHLNFGGLQAYHGSAQHMHYYQERKEAISAAVDQVKDTIHHMGLKGIPCETVTGAGTGTYPFETESGIYTEVQPGSYILMDMDYGSILDEDGRPFSRFENSLFVYTQIMSRTSSEFFVVDAGLKCFTAEKGLPGVFGKQGLEFKGASDEHGVITVKEAQSDFRLGDKLKLIPPHCDPTVNLHDWYVGFRKDRVEAVWPVTARGPGF